ncbi:cation:proton antiporter [Amycolatopsis sp. CA-230715]|uniref:cation:proton antiporter n=1 Tax=Amycolatopsis sp. CA-230715 TaxID=2745196 RepID=UPI001C341A09|nr:cation:proton antiporter [Amycolatopsis sp. CA-230715]QWF82451.1 Na(+)/H(+)-K(+) antiporter GerN [Amycolatopsis sp. CA-230715]
MIAATAVSASVAQPPPPIAADSLWLFLLQVGVLLTLALLFGRLAVRFSLPPLVGELAAGVLLGPSLLGAAIPSVTSWLFPPDAQQAHLLDSVGQVGVVLLVGLTGLTLELGQLRDQVKPASSVAVCGVLLPIGGGVLAGYLMPDRFLPGGVDRTVFALFLGVAMGVTAIPVIAKTLADMNLLETRVGKLILTAGVFDDAIGWLLLSIVSAMAVAGVHPGSVLMSISVLLGFLLAAGLVVRPLVRLALTRASRSSGPGPLIVTVVAVVSLGAAASQALKLEAVFGAFVAGVVVGSCPGLDRARLEPLRIMVMSVLAPLFLATVGLRVDLTNLADAATLAMAAVVLLVAAATKFGGGYAGGRIGGLAHWDALSVGAGLNARGVVGVVVASVGRGLGLLTPGMYATVLLLAIATSLMAPVVLRSTIRRSTASAVDRPSTVEEHA